MKIKNRQDIIGLTLIEILIGIIITTIMMAAMYTSYSVVNQSYNQVSEKAKISRSSRDLVSMLMRDVRMSGFRYYAGTHTISKFALDNKLEIKDYKISNLKQNQIFPEGIIKRIFFNSTKINF